MKSIRSEQNKEKHPMTISAWQIDRQLDLVRETIAAFTLSIEENSKEWITFIRYLVDKNTFEIHSTIENLSIKRLCISVGCDTSFFGGNISIETFSHVAVNSIISINQELYLILCLSNTTYMTLLRSTKVPFLTIRRKRRNTGQKRSIWIKE
jgi:hypothetical protein